MTTLTASGVPAGSVLPAGLFTTVPVSVGLEDTVVAGVGVAAVVVAGVVACGGVPICPATVLYAPGITTETCWSCGGARVL